MIGIHINVIIQSHKFYDRIMTRIFVSIPKYKYSYNCKYLYFKWKI